MGGISNPAVQIGAPVIGASPNTVLVADASTDLAGVAGVNGQVVGFGVGGVPQAVAGPAGAVNITYDASAAPLVTWTFDDANAGPSFTFNQTSKSGKLNFFNGVDGTLDIGVNGTTAFLSTSFGGNGFTIENNGSLVFKDGGVDAGALLASGDWYFGASDPGGTGKVRIDGAIVVAQNTATALAIGSATLLLTATPALINLGGSIGNNGAGASGNLKLALYNNGANGDFYGIGVSANIVEYQASNAAAATGSQHAFFRNGVYIGGSLATDWIFGATDPGGADKVRINGALTINSAVMIQTRTAFTNGAAAAAGTLLNAPVAGNPTKWIPINDNGTTRYIPAW